MDELHNKARYLRNNMTKQEQKIWSIIKNKSFYGYRFLRQYPIGNYIVDFVCRSKKVVIEIDGGQHNANKNIQYDNKRTKFLEEMGYKVVRFWNNDIDTNMLGVYKVLQDTFGIKED